VQKNGDREGASFNIFIFPLILTPDRLFDYDGRAG